MPGPPAHDVMMEEASKGRPFWKSHSQEAVYGSTGPDALYFEGSVPHFKDIRFYLKNFRLIGKPYEQVANVMHWEGSFEFFCTLLDYIKKAPPEKQNKLRAFAYGYFSHVIADCLFHPNVYRVTGDHPRYHPFKTRIAHRLFESWLDTYLIREKKGIIPSQLAYDELVSCHEPNSGRTLDEDIFRLFNHGISEVYNWSRLSIEGLIFSQLFDRFNKKADQLAKVHKQIRDHPIQEAYRDFITLTRIPYRHNIPQFLNIISGLRGVIPKDKLSAMQESIMTRREWNDDEYKLLLTPSPLNPILKLLYVEEPADDKIELKGGRKFFDEKNRLLPRRTALELFDYSVKMIKKVVDVCEDFFDSKYRTSYEYFADKATGIPFLDVNEGSRNLDAGSLSKANSQLWKLGKNLDQISLHQLEFIHNTYKTIDNIVLV